VLANSIKKRGRCIAGIEITNGDIESPEFGAWIRPIDETQDEGMLLTGTTVVEGVAIKPLDVISIKVSGPANDPNHPEDWIIKTDKTWKIVGSFGPDALSYLLSLPHLQNNNPDLWEGTNYVDEGEAQSTLQLMKLGNERSVTCEFVSFGGENPKLKTRMFCGEEPSLYKVSVTDPVFSAKNDMSPPKIRANGTKSVTIPAETFIVLSLAPPFNGGKQYKVVAAIIES